VYIPRLVAAFVKGTCTNFPSCSSLSIPKLLTNAIPCPCTARRRMSSSDPVLRATFRLSGLTLRSGAISSNIDSSSVGRISCFGGHASLPAHMRRQAAMLQVSSDAAQYALLIDQGIAGLRQTMSRHGLAQRVCRTGKQPTQPSQLIRIVTTFVPQLVITHRRKVHGSRQYG
jgi:hypothetical protein